MVQKERKNVCVLWGNIIRSNVFTQPGKSLCKPVEKENSFITEQALEWNVMHVVGSPLRDSKDRRKSHLFL